MDLGNRFEINRNRFYGTDGRIEDLAENGQNPHTLILTCSDSCMNINKIFGLEIGEAIVMRSGGPIIPAYNPDSSISQLMHENLSVAINEMDIDTLALIGHTQCSTAGKLAKNLFGCGDIPCMKKIAEQLLQAALCNVGDSNRDLLVQEIERQFIIQGIKNLFDYPCVIKAIKENRITVEGLLFDIETGRLKKLKADGTEFRFDTIAGPPEEKRIDLDGNQKTHRAANA